MPELFRCFRKCYFREKLWSVGEETVGEIADMPRHFISVNTEKPGELAAKREGVEAKGERVESARLQREQEEQIVALHPEGGLLTQFNNAELRSYAMANFGHEFPEGTKRPDMLRFIASANKSRKLNNQQIASGMSIK